MREYWEERYRAESMIWGEEPSSTAPIALDCFRKRNCRTVLVPGAGYGRNAKLFAEAGLAVTGVEIAEEACRIAGTFVPGMRMIHDSVTAFDPGEGIYDALYSYNLLHLFLEAARRSIVSRWERSLKKGGLLFCSVCSEMDPGYGRGKEVESCTFESKPGRPVHYFNEEDLRDHFSRFHAIGTGIARDRESHGSEGPHVHVVRYIIAEKG